MVKARPAAGGGRWIEVAPERLARWVDGFEARHGGVAVEEGPEVVRLSAADGAVAECHVPFPPLDGDLVAHALRDRRVGVLLVRLGGFACGVFEGERLVASKVGARLVQGRSAAGGWSQRRFARRRGEQARAALGAASRAAAGVLAPRAADLDALVCGGDRRAVGALRGDRDLVSLFALETGPFLAVPDPRLTVLQRMPSRFRAARVRLVEPA